MSDLSWLAGLTDGEGCIYARLINKSKNLYVQVQVHCASARMIDAVEVVYKAYGIEYLREEPWWQPRSTRPTHRITVGKLESVQQLLHLIRPHLRVKDREAEVTLRFLKTYVGVPIRQKPSVTERARLCVQLKALKRDELLVLEQPGEANQQPSESGDALEGSTTRR